MQQHRRRLAAEGRQRAGRLAHQAAPGREAAAGRRLVQQMQGDPAAAVELAQHRDVLGGDEGSVAAAVADEARHFRSEEHTSELQSLMRIYYDVLCLTTETYITSKRPTYLYENQEQQTQQY